MQMASKNSSRDVSPHPDPLPVWAGRGKQIHALGHDGGAHLQTTPFLPLLPLRRRVALLGIAQRTVRVKYASKTRKSPQSKPLPESIKTIGDWILVKRLAKKLTPGHVALKMGIATSLVCSWESNTCQPDSQQLERLAEILGFEAENYMTFAGSTANEQSEI
jgi:DNA-binding transcriptional regulator YiaG